MSKQKTAWGIEIGSSGIKAIKLVASETGADIENYAVVPYKQVLSAPDVDAGETIRLALQEFLSKNELEGSSVVASVSGAIGVARFATLPPVDPKRIPEIVKFEAVQQIPFPIEQAEWDYQIFQQADMPDVKVGVFAVAKDRLIEYMANFNAANIRLESLTLSPLGVFNAFAYDHKLDESRKCTAYVDIGTQATDVIIVEDNVPWIRTFPIGGHHLTEALVRQLKISYARAEEEKINLATSKMGKQMLQAMRGVVLDLAQEISRSINYYQQLNRGSEVKRIVGVGASFKLPGLVKFLSQNLPVEIEKLEQFNRLEVVGRHGSRLIQHSVELSSAYGLALQGLGLGRVGANLLPRQILLERLWKAKQWWFAGAAACALAAAGVAGVVWMAQQAAAEKVISNPMLRLVNDEATKYKTELMGLKSDDPRSMSETLIRTQAYRTLYPTILQDVSAAMASIHTAPVLLAEAPNYGLIKASSEKNRRVRIRKVDLTYVPPKPKSGAVTMDPASTFVFSQTPGGAFNPETCAPPQISVVVHCSTEMDAGEAATLVGQTVKPWLEKERARLDGAYAKWEAAKKQVETAGDDESRAAARAALAAACPDRLHRILIENNNQLFILEGGGVAVPAKSSDISGHQSHAPGGALGADAGLPPLSRLLPSRPDIGVKAPLDFKIAWDFVLVNPEVANMMAANSIKTPEAAPEPAAPAQ